MARFSQIEDELSEVIERAKRLVDSTEPRLFTVRPQLSAWSASECIAHLSISTEQFLPPLRAAIEDAAITPQDIDAIYASANGSVRGDALEAQALHALFGDAHPPVVATKGVFGEYSAGGGLQLAAALLAVEEQVVHASVGFEAGEIAVNRETRNAPLRYVLVNSLSAGGGVVSAVIARDDA